LETNKEGGKRRPENFFFLGVCAHIVISIVGIPSSSILGLGKMFLWLYKSFAKRRKKFLFFFMQSISAFLKEKKKNNKVIC
jgi:hypothetical protein